MLWARARRKWLQFAEGVLSLNEIELTAGGGASPERHGALTLTTAKELAMARFQGKHVATIAAKLNK
jgi:hypothetical protein